MPAKYVVKDYVVGGTYHCTNRGIDGRVIFADKEDTQTFLHLLEYYVTPRLHTRPLQSGERGYRAAAIAGKVKLLAFCLVSDHYHLLLQQEAEDALGTFMQCICSTYAMYFNQRAHRAGPLYQGTYKAVRVQTPEEISAVIRHIHRHDALASSADAYAGKTDLGWLTTAHLAPSPREEPPPHVLLDAHG